MDNFCGITEPIFDIHCHDFDFACVHPSVLKSFTMRTYLKSLGMIGARELLTGLKNKDAGKITEQYERKLIDNIDKSHLDHIALLAFDGVYDKKGKLDRGTTPWYVSNEHILKKVIYHPKIIPGYSINPLRRDWENELDKCVSHGIRLIKWLPSAMGFSPDGYGCSFNPGFDYLDRMREFYEKIEEAGITILTHVGFDKAIPTIDDSYSDLERLHVPLSMGVKMIAAHCCGEQDFDLMVRMLEKYPNLYLDNAGMSTIHRRGRLKESAKYALVRDRVVYGADYPIRAWITHFMPELLKNKLWKKAKETKNPFDRDIIIKKAMGFTDFGLGYKVLGI